jgi:uncharacterized membrane protein YfcA
MIELPLFYYLAIPVVLMVGLSKGGFGGGLGTLAVPVLSLVVDPRLAAAVLLPILCAMDLVSLWMFRGNWDKRNLKIILPAAIIGIVAGALTFRYMDANMIRLLVGIMALYFVGHYLRSWLWGRYLLQRAKPQAVNRLRGSFWGSVSGYVSYIAHAGGPPISIYLLPQHMHKTRFVGTTVAFFTAVNYLKLFPYAWFGQLDANALATSLALLPLAPLGVWLGVFLHRRVSDKGFYMMCYGLLFFAGIKLIIEGSAGIF